MPQWLNPWLLPSGWLGDFLRVYPMERATV